MEYKMSNSEIKNESNMNASGGVAKWLMAVMPGRAWSVVLSLAALTTMGLEFLWRCPDAGFLSEQLGAYWLLRRQVLWMSIGLSCFFLAVMVGWQRWLKAAPFLAVGWLAMYVVACCSPQVKHHLFVNIGCLRVNVMAWCSLALALLLAWIAEKLSVRRVMRFLLVAGVVLSGVFAVQALGNHERMAHVAAYFGLELERDADPPDEVMLRQWAQEASSEATCQAHWFSRNDEMLRQNSLPGRFTYSMPFAAALVFGKWFNVLVVAFFGMFAVVLAWCYRRAENVGKKVFVAVAGGAYLLQAAYGYGACLGFMSPELRSCVPLVSYGGCVVIEWIMAGMLVALVRDDANGQDARCPRFATGKMPVVPVNGKEKKK